MYYTYSSISYSDIIPFGSAGSINVMIRLVELAGVTVGAYTPLGTVRERISGNNYWYTKYCVYRKER